jgi:serine/threonine protein kinase
LETIAHYRILERIGESGLGEIFRARDTKFGRTVALTIPPSSIQDDSSKRDLLLSDAKQAMTVSHPNLATLYEAGEDNGRLYLAFEFVPGDTLDRVIAGHPLNVRRALDLTSQVADALAEAHAAELPHGDITTRKVVVTPKGNAKLLDVGFSRWTREGSTEGGEAADLEAVSVLFFEMLTGRPPSSTGATPTAVNKSLPAEVDAIAAKQHQSAVALAAELRSLAALLQARAEAADKSRPSPKRGARKRTRAPWIVAIGALLAAAAAAAWWWLR